MARARARGCVLIPTQAWPGCDLTLDVITRTWVGLGQGRGRLRHQNVTLRAVGRGRAARPRHTETCLPPPSIKTRRGLQPGEIPIHLDHALAHLAPPPPAAAPVEATTAPPVGPVDPWAALTRSLPPGTTRRRP
jgi:hypothetical protein